MTDVKPELLPCPFCGEHAEYDEACKDRTIATAVVMFHVGCSNSECIAYAMTDSFDRKSDAAKSWNTRPATQDAAVLVEALEDIRDMQGSTGFQPIMQVYKRIAEQALLEFEGRGK